MSKLTDRAIKSIKAGTSIKKLSDGAGLVLLVYPNGGKYWAYRYRYLGKEKSLSLGVYPEVSLAEARDKLIDARKLVLSGQDPSEARKVVKRQAILSSENNFEAIAREWIEAKSTAWTPRYTSFLMKRLEKDLFPRLGSQ